MAQKIVDGNCAVCRSRLKITTTDSSGYYGTCATCNAPYSHAKYQNGSVIPLDSWVCTLIDVAIPLMQRFWDETHSRIPPLDPILRTKATEISSNELDIYNKWMSQYSDLLANEAEKEQLPVFGKLS